MLTRLTALPLLFVLMSADASASTFRYALVVGSNIGYDTAEGLLPPLKHAEREAQRLYERLAECCHFDPAEDRIVLVQAPTKRSLKKAVERIGRKLEEDRRKYGEVEALFGFFFTGHGLRGRLLLSDGALEKATLGNFFRRIGADLNIGVFDACFSGSIGFELQPKGVKTTPGVNVLQNLPEEILTAEGSVWFVSSSPNQLSYEDKNIGGIFTHYFTEALNAADRTGPGITLERVWDYARRKTVSHTSERGRSQQPQQLTKLRATGPLFFSFPQERDAHLVLGSSVVGTFLLSYAHGQLTEVVDKSAGSVREVPVYSGSSQILLLRGGAPVGGRAMNLAPGDRLVVRTITDDIPGLPADEELWVKGEQGQRLHLGVSPNLDRIHFALLGYEFVGSSRLALSPKHRFFLGGRWHPAPLVFDLRLSYGFGNTELNAWGFRLHTIGTDLRGGCSVGLSGSTELMVQASLEGGRSFQTYRDHTERNVWFFQPSGVLSFLHYLSGWIGLEIFVRGGLMLSSGSGIASEHVWTPTIGTGAQIILRGN